MNRGPPPAHGSALATVVHPVRVAFAAMMSLSTREAFPTTPIRHLAGLPENRLGLKGQKTVGDDRPHERRDDGCRVDAAG
jgi:hypothetical protein